MLLVSTGEVCREPRTELFLGVDRSWGKVHEPSPGRPRQGNMEVCRHYGGVSTGCRNGGVVNLQDFDGFVVLSYFSGRCGRNLDGQVAVWR
jgi:hypothetical protein